MKALFPQTIVFVVFAAYFIAPAEVSGQLFRRIFDEPRENSNQGAKSQLPNPGGAISARNYGPPPPVSEEVRAEVSGRIPVRPAPDFHANPDMLSDYKDIPKLQRVMTPNWYKGGTPGNPPRIRPFATPTVNIAPEEATDVVQ